MPHDKSIGIDLGTSNSAMAWVDDAGRSAMIPNAEGEFVTPSVVFFSETEVIVGKAARTAITSHPEMVAQWVKRDMGAAYYSHPIRGHYLPPEVIQACILRKLKADLVSSLGPDTQAVITVPAYFDEVRRKATADAGEMAGLRVLDIVNEPTAAAIAFGEALGYLSASGRPRQELNVLVYDLGGGTFDVTLLRMAAGKVQTLATDGDVQLGGHDWDKRLVDLTADCFLKNHQIDPRQDPATLNRLYLDAMEAKHTLSARNRAAIEVQFQGRRYEVVVTREQFEELSADLLERTSYTSRQLLGTAGLEWKDVQRVLLVGGSTRMPMVARMLLGLTGLQPERSVNPDEAVARGAALYADHLLAARSGMRSTFHVTNVNAHSLGVEGIDMDTLRRKNVVLISRNTPLPARHTERFATKAEGQRSIMIKVLEGESLQPDDCIPIGHTTVRDLPGGLPRGWPVEITFEYGTNGRLTVEALVPGTHHTARLELVRESGLSNEGLNRWKQPVSNAGRFSTFGQAAQEALHNTQPSSEPLPSGIGFSIVDSTTACGTPATKSQPATSPADDRVLAGGWVSSLKPLAASIPDVPRSAASAEPAPDPSVSCRLGTWADVSPAFPAASSAGGVQSVALQEAELPLVRTTGPGKKRRFPKWAERLIGHTITLLVFAVVSYYMIAHFRPEYLPPYLGGRPKSEQKQDETQK
jgi:molecular chaperone DnaK